MSERVNSTVRGFVSTKFAKGNDKYQQISLHVTDGNGGWKWLTVKAFPKNEKAFKNLRRVIQDDNITCEGFYSQHEYMGKIYTEFVAMDVTINN